MAGNTETLPVLGLAYLPAGAALLSAALILLLRPLLQRYALARPNARSSHTKPTPQGGGIAVVASAIALAAAGDLLWGGSIDQVAILYAATGVVAIVGLIDDLRPLPVLPRLLLQALAIAVALAALPAGPRVAPLFPWWIERAFLLVGLIWFVNLVNFMDGIDLMTVAEMVPITAAIAFLGFVGIAALSAQVQILALALFGAILGFAPFNKPVARLFLGDVGSLPIGLMVGWMLVLLAVSGEPAAALLLPLYYVADATITLLRRVIAGEPFWQAHRSHFYQRACARGWSVPEITGRVFVVNLVLAGLAIVTVVEHNALVVIGSLAFGSVAVAALMVSFERGKRSGPAQ